MKKELVKRFFSSETIYKRKTARIKVGFNGSVKFLTRSNHSPLRYSVISATGYTKKLFPKKIGKSFILYYLRLISRCYLARLAEEIKVPSAV